MTRYLGSVLLWVIAVAFVIFPVLFGGCGAAGVGAYALVRDRCLVMQHSVEIRSGTTLAQDQGDIAAIRVVCDNILEEIQTAVNEGNL